MQELNLKNKIENKRITRTVIGLKSGMDISTIFDDREKDFIDGEFITHENFDNDDIYYVQKFGYTKRKSLLNSGFNFVITDSLSDDITIDNLI